jgi:transcriptional regulator with XRE-family HTH domain
MQVASEQFVPMDTFAAKLRDRAAELGLSNAEVARRAGLTERRYAHYVSGDREPDLTTLVRIAGVLQTTPNSLLGCEVESAVADQRRILIDRLLASAHVMGDYELHLVAAQAEVVARLSEAEKGNVS